MKVFMKYSEFKTALSKGKYYRQFNSFLPSGFLHILKLVQQRTKYQHTDIF